MGENIVPRFMVVDVSSCEAGAQGSVYPTNALNLLEKLPRGIVVAADRTDRYGGLNPLRSA